VLRPAPSPPSKGASGRQAPIVAIATAPGRGGIGVVRVSGPDLAALSERLLGRALLPRQATYLPFTDVNGDLLDQGIALYFRAPHSYTGEDVLELQGHGGPVVMQLLLAWVLQVGAPEGVRLARPGEFTERAFLNDKLDLAQAEAVADLIDASTSQAARGAARSLKGEFSQEVHALVARVVRLRSLVEATLDFPEEEIDFLNASDALGQLEQIQQSLATLLKHTKQGAILREGIRVVLVGQPNVGKSSLLNALAGQELAIVTAIAGTTRDRVQQAIQLDGVPLTIVDTAGLREPQDEVERIGIERSWEALENADVVVELRAIDPGAANGIAAVPALSAQITQRLARGAKRLEVVNKADLLAADALVAWPDDALLISVATGAGMAQFKAALLAAAGWQPSGESVVLARARHVQALELAQQHINTSEQHGRAGSGLELFAEELRLAQLALNSITGEFSADDLLGVIFSTFCIGK
jgi:tRNA modification GTPase